MGNGKRYSIKIASGLKALLRLTGTPLKGLVIKVKNPKIYYIIDDDIDDQQFLIEALSKDRPLDKCFSAFNGKQGLSQLLQGNIPLPDIIFLDLNMPGMNGRQCLEGLKNAVTLQQIPVIIYSTSSDAAEKKQMMQLGAAHYLVKAINEKGLRHDLSIILTEMYPEIYRVS